MRARWIHRGFAAPAVLALGLCIPSPPAAIGAEIGATHIVFEKPVKMKKADTFLYLPLLDQSQKSDKPDGNRLVECRVFAEGARGPVDVKGRFRLRLVGEVGGSAAAWKSSIIDSPVDANGRSRFQPAEVLSLVGEANTANAEPRLMWLEFDGGKGKKVSRLTVDCENREAES